MTKSPNFFWHYKLISNKIPDAQDLPYYNCLPLQQKLLKTLQNEAIFPLITMNVLIYVSNLINSSY